MAENQRDADQPKPDRAGRLRWIAIGLVTIVIWVVGTFGIAFAVVEWRQPDPQKVTQSATPEAQAQATLSPCDKLMDAFYHAPDRDTASLYLRMANGSGCPGP